MTSSGNTSLSYCGQTMVNEHFAYDTCRSDSCYKDASYMQGVYFVSFPRQSKRHPEKKAMKLNVGFVLVRERGSRLPASPKTPTYVVCTSLEGMVQQPNIQIQFQLHTRQSRCINMSHCIVITAVHCRIRPTSVQRAYIGACV